jgi:uncharacterized protein
MPIFINQNIYPGEFLLHKKYAATETILDLIWTHSNIVVDVCLYLLDHFDFDKTELKREVVIQAALLHEVGVYACGGFDWIPGQPQSTHPYIQHGIIGAWILQQEGYANPVVQAAFCHIGMGLTAEDIRSHGLDVPEVDMFPQTRLQQFITYASKFHSKAPNFRTSQEIRDSLAKFSNEKVKIFDQLEKMFGVVDLTTIQQKYQEWEKSFTFRVEQLTKVTGGVNLNAAGIATTTAAPPPAG